MQIPLTDIAVVQRIRKKQTMEGITAMAQSLKELGQIQSIIVRKPDEHDDPAEIGSRPWVLVAGGRRYAGAVMAGLEDIRAEDLGAMGRYMRVKIELEENLQREEMHFADVAETKLRLHELYQTENPEQQITDTAQAIGESVANVSRDLALAKAIRRNPGLRNASSKKAALQSVKMEAFGKAKEMDLAARGGSSLRSIASRLETADARDWLRRQAVGSIDLFLSDVPYGIDYFDLPVGEDLSRYDDSAATTRDVLVDAIPQIVRTTNEQGWIVLFTGWEGYFFVRELMQDVCTTHFDYFEPDENGMKQKRCHSQEGGKLNTCNRGLRLPAKPWIWYRPNSRNNSMHPDLHAQNQYEPILVVNRGSGKIVSEERSGNVLVHDAVYSDRIHDMQKPISLGMDIIGRLALRNSTVGDCFMGSAAFLAAAAEMSCDFRGCDSNPNLLGPAIGLVAMSYKGEVTV